MASLLSDGNQPLEQEDDGGLVQKCHDAYAAQPDLPKDLAKEGIVNPLGMEPYDWFVLSALTAAGVRARLGYVLARGIGASTRLWFLTAP